MGVAHTDELERMEKGNDYAVELNKTERISPTSRQVAQWLTNNYEYIEGSVPRLYYR